MEKTMISVHCSNLRLARGVRAGYRACLIAIAIGLLLIGASAASAQSIFAGLSGTVTDPTGAVVQSAKVTVQNVETRVAQQLVTNSAGFFSVPQLQPGTYNVTVEAKGFERWQGTDIALNSADDKTLTIPLKPGAASITVEVSASASEIAVTDTGAKIERITSDELDNLAMVGRNSIEILKILPGAAQLTNGGTNRAGYTGEMIESTARSAARSAACRALS